MVLVMMMLMMMMMIIIINDNGNIEFTTCVLNLCNGVSEFLLVGWVKLAVAAMIFLRYLLFLDFFMFFFRSFFVGRLDQIVLAVAAKI